MQPFSFMTATEILFGCGQAANASGRIAATGDHVLLVHGASRNRSGWLFSALDKAGCRATGFEVAAEPDNKTIEKGIEVARAANSSVVCAIGGGSVVDAGKAIAALVSARRPLFDHLEVVGKGWPLEEDPLPFVAIPTTAGTGGEVTSNAVIGIPEHKRKVSLRDARMLLRLAIVDPALTDCSPGHITLASGLDAITQVIEPYVCTRANAFTDALCRDTIPPGLAGLIRLMEGEDARDIMAWVSLCGGLALANAGLGAVHGLAGPLGGLTGAAHGAICGALLPHVLEASRQRVKERNIRIRLDQVANWISEAFDEPPESGMANAADRLHDWSRQHGLAGLKAQGVDASVRAMAAEAAQCSSSMKANPVMLPVTELLEIMEATA